MGETGGEDHGVVGEGRTEGDFALRVQYRVRKRLVMRTKTIGEGGIVQEL